MEIQGCDGMPEETFWRLTGVRKRTFTEMVAALESAEATLKKRGGKPNRLAVADDAGILAGIPDVSAHWSQLRCEREYCVSHDSLV